jgi:hypothetical protein
MNRFTLHTLKKFGPPALLAAAGTWLLVGCIYIPTGGRVVKGTDVSKKVGAAKSKRPIRPFEATRDDVVRVLGAPVFTSDSGHVVAYWWRVQNGFVSYPQCLFMGDAIYGDRALVLHFDDQGLLTSYEVARRDDRVFDIPSREMHMNPWLPTELQRERYLQFQRRARAATRPAASQPADGDPPGPDYPTTVK